MCGIVGYVGTEEATPLLLDGLKRLDYRGYDSSGVATIYNDTFYRHRALGRLETLHTMITHHPLKGTVGLGHTRWATHGKPTVANAHPHQSDHISLVHNGIIENAQQLRAALVAAGQTFASETDTEVIVYLLEKAMLEQKTPLEALQQLTQQIHGSYAIGVLFLQDPDKIYCIRHKSPLVIGVGQQGYFIASDVSALTSMCHQCLYLKDGDIAHLEKDNVTVWSCHGKKIKRPIQDIQQNVTLLDKGPYRHYMEKEMHAQPEMLKSTLSHYITQNKKSPFLTKKILDKRFSRLFLIGCGTAFHAGCVAKYWFEELAKLSVEVDIASEFRYRQSQIDPKGLYLFISQSGETADTLSAMHHIKSQGGLLCMSCKCSRKYA